jgi:hypothetical protein
LQSKTLVVLCAVTILGLGSTAMAKGGGGGGGGGGKGGSSHGMHGHGHFDHGQFHNRFLRNQFLFGGGWGWDWGLWPYDNPGGGNTTVVVFPKASPQAATGSVDPAPCNWKQQDFAVPSSAGGTRPVQVVTCR